MKFLVVYSTTEGHTKKIASFIADQLKEKEFEVWLQDTTGKNKPEDFDSVIIAASIHAGQYAGELMDYVVLHSDQLNKMPCAFYSVGLTITRNDPKNLQGLADTTKFFLEVTKWKPVLVQQNSRSASIP